MAAVGRDRPHRNVFVKPEPITKKGIQTYNRQTLYIYEGKNGPITFEPHREKKEGSALGSIFKKTTDTSVNPKEWMGKVGDRNGLLKNDPRSRRTVTRIEINISATQEKIAADLYKELGRGMFDVPKTRLAKLPVSDRFTEQHFLAIDWVEREITETLRVMSRFVDGYHDFAQARTREGGRDYSFTEYIQEYHRPPDFLLTEEGVLVPLHGLIELLAVGRILADTDLIGGDGGNAGFKWVYDDNGTIIGTQAVKIDPGYAFQFKTPTNWLFNKRQDKDGPRLDNDRDIQIANNHQDMTIKWESMTFEQRDAFLSSLQNCGRYLSEEVLSFLFYREGRFQDMPARVAQQMASDFREWTALQFQIFGEEVSAFKRENPLHQLRVQYIDKWGELPLLLSDENVLTSEFFTPLAIKEHRELPEQPGRPSADNPMRGITGMGQSTSWLVDPNQLFTQTRHVLLLGPPGVGKSALCQNIVYNWGSGRAFNHLHAMYWIPLRRLNKEVDREGFLEGVTEPDVFLARAVANILLEDQSLTDACLAEIRDHKATSVFILDGYDEATVGLTRALLSLLSDRGLSIFLTSRAGFTDHITTYIDQTIENTGFADQEVIAYAARFFTRKEESAVTKQRVESFLKAIRKNPDFFEISHNPLQLQILCSLWESGSSQRGFPSSLSGLYQTMVEQLFRWEYHRRREDVRSVPGDVKQSLFSALGLIAQRGLAEGKLIISEMDVAAWLESGTFSEKNLLETGILKISGSGANTCYHFPHQTFQEYLAAYWISNQPRGEQEAFIQAYRDHPRYRVVIPFLAGITYQRDATLSKEVTKGVFQALCQNIVLNDQTSRQELVQIIIKSINECPGYTGALPAVEALFQAHPSLLETEVQVQEIPEVPLHTAIRQGQVHFLKWLVGTQGKEVLNKTTSKGATPMHAAARNGDLETMQWLDEQNPELFRTPTNDGVTPMHEAAYNGHLGAMQWLHGRDPELFRIPTNDGETPMHPAAANGHLEAMQWLHDKDPQLFRTPTKDGQTPMHWAAYNGHLEAMQWLHEKDPEFFRTPRDDGRTPMHWAAYNGHLGAMQWLHDKDPEFFRTPRGDGWTPMHLAAYNGHLEAMQWLHDKDPEFFRTPNYYGQTPMHLAADNGHLEAMQWLNGKDPQLFRTPTNDGWTPMHFVARNGQLEAMQWLHEKDPELFRTPTNDGETPMHWAARNNGHLEAMQWLYDKDPQLFRTPRNDGETPMHLAARNGHLGAMQWLHDKDPQLLRIPRNDGGTPMHYAAHNGQLEAMQWLHDKDPQLFRTPRNGGWTPMHSAAANGQLGAMQWLHGKDPQLFRTPDNDGWTPMHLAARNGRLGAMQWLHDKDLELFRKPGNGGRISMHSTAPEAIQWLRDYDPKLFRTSSNSGSISMHLAAENGNLQAMQRLHDKDSELFRIPTNSGGHPCTWPLENGQLRGDAVVA